MIRLRLGTVGALVCTWLGCTLFACSSPGEPCTPGQEVACSCPSGEQGSQVCQDDGAFARCVCEGTGGSGLGGGATGAGGQGGGASCVPSTSEPCYSGPPGTENVGVCHGGTRTCSASGTWGACDGEVTPTPENCAEPEDEDCNGDAVVCGGAHLWSKDYGDEGSQGGTAPRVVVDQNDDIVLISGFDGDIDLGGGTLTSAGSQDVLVAKLAPDGSHLWSKRFGDADDQAPHDVDVDADGNILVLGVCRGTLDFGDGPLACGSQEDIFVAKLDPDGNTLWSKRFGSAGLQVATELAVDRATGEIVLLGVFENTINFGGSTLVATGSWLDIAIAKLDASGGHVWSKSFVYQNGFVGGYSVQAGLVVDPAGDVAFTGLFTGTFDFGGLPLTGVNEDVLLVKLSGAGDHIWSKRFGDAAGAQDAWALAVDGTGNLFVGGSLQGTLDFGGAPPMINDDNAGLSLYVAKLDPSGNGIWNQRYQMDNPYNSAPRGIALDGAGNPTVVGSFEGSVNLGTGTFTAPGIYKDAFVMKLRGDSGATLWAKQFGGDRDDSITAVAVDSGDNNILAGAFRSSSIDFGGDIFTNADPTLNTTDMFLVKLAP